MADLEAPAIDDALMAHLEESEAPQPDGPTRTEIPESAKAPPPPESYKIKVNGREIDATRDQLIQWAQQGHDYGQRMAEINRLRAEQDQKMQSVSQIESKYKPIEEYIQKNPQWWDHVNKTWEQRSQILNDGSPQTQELLELKNQLQELKSFRDDFLKQKDLETKKQQDSALDSEIKSIRKNYPDINFDAVDDTGKTLEYRILEHAQANDISNFRAAFRDYQHDKLIQLAQEKAKETVNQDLQKKTKLGLLGKTKVPLKGIQRAENVKSKSWDDLAQEAIAAFQTS